MPSVATGSAGTGEDVFARLRAMLAGERRRRLIAFMVAAASWWAPVHAAAAAALGAYSLRHPLLAWPLWILACAYLPYLVPPLLAWRLGGRGAFAPKRVAADLDRLNPSAPDPFRSLLSLGNHPAPALEAMAALYRAHVDTLRLPPRRLGRGPGLRLAASAIILAAVAAITGSPAGLLSRACLPWLALSARPRLEITIAADRTAAGTGDTVHFTGQARPAPAGLAFYAYVEARGGGESRRFPVAAADGRLRFDYGPARGDFSIRFAAENGSSPSLRIKVSEPPFAERLRVTIIPPAYTRAAPETLAAGVHSCSALPGSEIRREIRADRPLRSLVFESMEEDSVRTRRSDSLPGGREFAVRRSPRHALDYGFRLTDRDGVRGAFPFPAKVEMRPDLPPEVHILAPAGDGDMPGDARIGITFQAKDDFGLGRLRLAYRVSGAGKPAREGEVDGAAWLERARAGLGTAAVTWDARGLGLVPGQVVELRLVAWDLDTVSGPKRGESEVRRLRLPTASERYASAEAKEQAAAGALRGAVERQREVQRLLEQSFPDAHREEEPPGPGEYEINRILVQDPADHVEAARAQAARLRAQLADKGEKGGNGGQSQALERFRRELDQEAAALPKGDQGRLSDPERLRNLDQVMRAQAGEREALKRLAEESARRPDPATQRALAEIQGDLDRKAQDQKDLKEYLESRRGQEQARSDRLRQALQGQAQAMDEAKAAADSLRNLVSQAMRDSALSPALLEKLKRVQDMLSEAIPDSLRRAMEERMRGQEVDAGELQRNLRDMLGHRQEMEENLDRALAMLEGLKDAQQAERWRARLNELAARQAELGKSIAQGGDAAAQDREQAAIASEAGKTLDEVARRARERPALQSLRPEERRRGLEGDMQKVRQGLQNAGAEGKAAAGRASRSAQARLEEMAGEMGAMASGQAGMDVDVQAIGDLLQESLALARLQVLIRSGEGARRREGWEGDGAAAYAPVADVARYLEAGVDSLGHKYPFVGQALLDEAGSLAASAEEARSDGGGSASDRALEHNRKLSRELLKLYAFARNLDASSGAGGQGGQGKQAKGGGQPGPGRGQGRGGGDLASQLRGVSGKQMAVNAATQELLRAMLEGRQGGGPGGGGQALGNREGELSEKLEGMAEGADDAGGAAKKLRQLAEEARGLENDLRRGEPPADIARRQQGFQGRLLEAARGVEERGESEQREAHAAQGQVQADAPPPPPPDEFLRLLRDARRRAPDLPLPEAQRRALERYYQTLEAR